MNNFHYMQLNNAPKTEKTTKLVQELQSIEKQLQEDHRKLAQKRKLQQQFYEDLSVNANKVNNANHINLADQIMNELLNQKDKNVPQIADQKIKFSQFEAFNQPKYNNNDYLANINANHDRVRQVLPSNQNPGFVNQIRPLQKQIPRQNQIVNKRQLQKMKLQNMNAQQQFPFGNNSRQKDRRKPQNQARSPQREPAMKDNYIPNIIKNKQRFEKQKQVIQNPFLKDEPNLKQKRQEQQKRYRLLLEQQMQEQKKRKQEQKLRLKQQQRQKYNNIPTGINIGIINNQNKPIIQNINKKKRDPNAQHIPLEKPSSQIRQSDLQFMKHQVLDLKNKYKKGRINHQQYQAQIKKLQIHYKIKADQVIQNQIQQKIVKVQNIPIQIQNIPEQSIKNSQRQKNPSIMQTQQHNRREIQILSNKNRSNINPINTQYAQQHYTNISVPIQSINRQPIPSNYSNYQPSSAPNLPNNPTDFQMQMMFKLLDQFKSIFKMQTQSHLNDKKALQQTLNKMIPNFNPNMMTQQINPTYISQPLQKQFHTEAKKVQKLDQHVRNNLHGVQYSYPQSSQSEISSSYIQKSLSGIVNKIPLTKKQKQQQKIEPNKDIIKFYERKYKIKKFKGFQYTQTQNQSNILIPSVSNFLQTKNSQNQLNAAFQRDLHNYKKMQKDRDIKLMMEKIKKSKQDSSNSSNSSSNPTKISKNKFVQQQFSNHISNFYQPQQLIKKPQTIPQNNSNPFLKKHISNEQNQSLSNPSNQSNQSSQPNKSNKFNSYQNITSPAGKSSQILQQQQYQTENKKSQNSSPENLNRNMQKFKKNDKQTNNIYNAKPLPKSTQPAIQSKPSNKQYPSSKILDTMKKNNQILAKYQKSPQSNYQSNFHPGSNSISSVKESNRIESSKEFSSRQYFSGHQISPVQRRQYQSSLETVRSQQQSGKFERKNNMDMLMVGSNQRSSYSNHYQSPIPSAHSINASPTIQSVQLDKISKNYQVQGIRLNDYYKKYPNIGQSQTVQSIEQSQSKLANFQKPPNSRKNSRTVSRKKQSVVKIANNSSSNQSASYKDELSGIPSEGSRQRSSMLKPPLSRQQNQSKLSSMMCQSGYQQTVQLRSNNKLQSSQSRRIGLNQNITPNTFQQVLEKNPELQRSVQSKNSSQNQNIRYTSQQLQYEPEPSQPIKPVILPTHKWRSLQQARKIAKQCRLKSGQDSHNRSSVQEKLSQLQSFIQNNPNAHLQSCSGLNSNRKEEVIGRNKQQKGETTTKKKDISKILDDLGQEQYQADFDSYKQQSQR